jgi:hypothetical protein
VASRWMIVAYADVCSAPCPPPYCASLPARLLLLHRSLPSQPTLHLSQRAQAHQRRQLPSPLLSLMYQHQQQQQSRHRQWQPHRLDRVSLSHMREVGRRMEEMRLWRQRSSRMVVKPTATPTFAHPHLHPARSHSPRAHHHPRTAKALQRQSLIQCSPRCQQATRYAPDR